MIKRLYRRKSGLYAPAMRPPRRKTDIKVIRFLFKLSVFLCLLCIILSCFLPVQDRQAGSKSNSVNMFAAMAAVGALLQDMDGFCERNPQSCETGKSVFGLMAEKAQQGAVFAYQWLSSSLSKGAENTEEHLAEQEKDKQPPGGQALSPPQPGEKSRRP